MSTPEWNADDAAIEQHVTQIIEKVEYGAVIFTPACSCFWVGTPGNDEVFANDQIGLHYSETTGA